MQETRRLGNINISGTSPSVAVPKPSPQGGSYGYGAGSTPWKNADPNKVWQTPTGPAAGGMSKPAYTSGTKPYIPGGAPTGLNATSFTSPGSINSAGPATYGTRVNPPNAGVYNGNYIYNEAEGIGAPAGGVPAAPAAFVPPNAYGPVPNAPTTMMAPNKTATGETDHMANYLALYKIHPQLATEYVNRSGDTIGWFYGDGQNQIRNQLFGGNLQAMQAFINGTSPQGSNVAPLTDSWLQQLNSLGQVRPPEWAINAYKQARAQGQPINPMYEPFIGN